MRKPIHVMDATHRNHSFIKIDKKHLAPLFKKATKTMREDNPNKSISEMVRIMLILSEPKRTTKKHLKFMEELIYFIKILEEQKTI